jgi:perosamine synthetase
MKNKFNITITKGMNMRMKKILYSKPTISKLEIDYVTDAVTNGWGDHCYDYITRFSAKLRDYFGVKYAWPTSSCHGALHIVLMALGVGPGDEVIVPDVTWVGSIFPVSWLGAKPVFVDVLPDTWCIDPEKIEDCITEKTKAIIVVHLYGNLVDMDAIMKISEKYHIPVIEDAAEALGSEYRGKKAGTIADFGVFSFHGTKPLTTGEGGTIISNRDDLKERITTIECQGRKPEEHNAFWVSQFGLKYKMSNLQAALGLGQFERADEIIDKKIRIFHWYKAELSRLPDINLNPEYKGTKNSYWMPTIIFGDSYLFNRDDLMAEMQRRGIAVRPFFYPVSMFPMYEHVTSNTVSYNLFKKAINLPSYYEMEKDDVSYVVSSLKSILGKT